MSRLDLRSGVATTAVVLALVVSACARPVGTASSPSSDLTTPSATTSSAPTSSPGEAASPSAPAPASPAASHAPTLVITSATFHTGEAGVAYASVGLAASGGLGAYSWSISGGALPGGLSIASSTVSGTPTAAGTFNFTVHVADTAGDSAIVYRAISIVRALAVSGSCSIQCNVEVGCDVVCGALGSVTGGATPFKYALSSGALPTGMTLNALDLAGAFPASPGSWKFQVSVTDAYGASGTVTALFNVVPHLAFAKTSASCSSVGVTGACTTTIAYTGGIPGVDPKAKATPVTQPTGAPGVLPGGFSAIAKGGILTISVSNGTTYYGTITLVLLDPTLCAPATSCAQSGAITLTVRV